jgi:excisionase family DNA binding protein
MESLSVTENQPAVRRLAFSMAEVASLTGVSRSTLYRLVSSGELKTVRLLSRRLIPARELERLL